MLFLLCCMRATKSSKQSIRIEFRMHKTKGSLSAFSVAGKNVLYLLCFMFGIDPTKCIVSAEHRVPELVLAVLNHFFCGCYPGSGTQSSGTDMVFRSAWTTLLLSRVLYFLYPWRLRAFWLLGSRASADFGARRVPTVRGSSPPSLRSGGPPSRILSGRHAKDSFGHFLYTVT